MAFESDRRGEQMGNRSIWQQLHPKRPFINMTVDPADDSPWLEDEPHVQAETLVAEQGFQKLATRFSDVGPPFRSTSASFAAQL